MAQAIPAIFFLYIIILLLAKNRFSYRNNVVKAKELRETDEYVDLLKKWNREKNGYITDTPSN